MASFLESLVNCLYVTRLLQGVVLQTIVTVLWKLIIDIESIKIRRNLFHEVPISMARIAIYIFFLISVCESVCVYTVFMCKVCA